MTFLMETKLESKRMEMIRRSCGYGNEIEVGAEGSQGGLYLAWMDDLAVELRSFSKSYIDVTIKDIIKIGCWRYTCFYEALVANDRGLS